ncbi:MAG: hypothetical protein LBP59_14655 [Planctomycetaceae bacterium]|jgi:hypothetical protein|nr:hypothetical protein [Planctomycetaceae bacterium]
MTICIKNINIGFFWACQSVFWLASFFAFLDHFWANFLLDDYFIILLFGCWVSVIFILLHLFQPETSYLIFAERNWLAALIFGVNFCVSGFLIYVSIIILAELVWYFLLQKIAARKILPKINQQPLTITENEINIAKNNIATNTDSDLIVKTGNTNVAELDKIDELAESAELAEFTELSESIWDAGKTQHITRRKLESGVEKLEGYFLVEFGEEQLTVSVHVPFYPVFERLPNVEAYLIDDDADAKTTVAKTQFFGARIDVKRANKNVNNLRLVVIVSG